MRDLPNPGPASWSLFIPAYNGEAREAQNPQPAGRDLFISAYNAKPAATLSNPPTGRLGIVHSCLCNSTYISKMRSNSAGTRVSPGVVGWNERSPTSRLGDSGKF